MQFAFGVLHLSPDVFWQMSIREFSAAMQGYRALHTPKKDPNRILTPDEMTPEQKLKLAAAQREHEDFLISRKSGAHVS